MYQMSGRRLRSRVDIDAGANFGAAAKPGHHWHCSECSWRGRKAGGNSMQVSCPSCQGMHVTHVKGEKPSADKAKHADEPEGATFSQISGRAAPPNPEHHAVLTKAGFEHGGMWKSPGMGNVHIYNHKDGRTAYHSMVTKKTSVAGGGKWHKNASSLAKELKK